MDADRLTALLPECLRQVVPASPAFQALLAVMAGLHAPIESRLAGLEQLFDPWRTPDPFLPRLAAWLDLDRLLDLPDEAQLLSTGTACLRHWLAGAVEAGRWRGTAKGLQRLLELATGTIGFVIIEDPPGAPPFHLQVQAPASLTAHQSLLEALINEGKPAHATAELRFLAAAEPGP